MKGKKWYESKSVWLGIVAIVGGLGSVFTGESTWIEFALVVLGAFQVYFRALTSKPLI